MFRKGNILHKKWVSNSSQYCSLLKLIKLCYCKNRKKKQRTRKEYKKIRNYVTIYHKESPFPMFFHFGNDKVIMPKSNDRGIRMAISGARQVSPLTMGC